MQDEIENISQIFSSACNLIDQARANVSHRINEVLVQRNWMLGKLISENEPSNSTGSRYGLKIISSLAKRLTEQYGAGFTKTNLYSYLQFYKLYPEIFHAVGGKLESNRKRLLSWTHYRILIQVYDDSARLWYEKETLTNTWSVRTLERNVRSQYYFRLLSTHKKELVKDGLLPATINYKGFDPTEFIKNPVISEFLGLKKDNAFLESDLEKAIITQIEKFLLELGKGFAFVARQQHIHTEKEDYYIDLVFYNIYLKCYVLIDLKTSKITHQDVGQMDMYVRMYDELKRMDGDNPTIGIVLCEDTDADIARYSVLHDNDHLFASKYMLYMPSKEELKREIENQKALYYLQMKENELTDI